MTNSLRRSAWQATFLGIAACAILAACTVACSRQAADLPVQGETSLSAQDSGFSVPESGNLVLMLGQDSEIQPILDSANGQNPGLRQGPEPAPFAIQIAVATVLAPIDGGAVIAINRRGLVHLTVQNRLVQLRWIDGAAEEFAGRSVAQGWIWDDKAMFLLHRNEIFEPELARTPVARIIATRMDGLIALPGFEPFTGTTDPEENDLYDAPYALFPRSRDRWLVQFRLVGPERTRTAFAAWNPRLNRLDPLDRTGYETAVRPAPMTEAPTAVKLVAETLGGGLIIDATMPDSSHQTWLRAGTDTLLAVRAVVTDDTTITSLASDGRLIRVAANTVHESSIDLPVPHAYFRDLALLNGFIIAVWEEDLFPDLGRSGLVIVDASRLGTGSSQPDS